MRRKLKLLRTFLHNKLKGFHRMMSQTEILIEVEQLKPQKNSSLDQDSNQERLQSKIPQPIKFRLSTKRQTRQLHKRMKLRDQTKKARSQKRVSHLTDRRVAMKHQIPPILEEQAS